MTVDVSRLRVHLRAFRSLRPGEADAILELIDSSLAMKAEYDEGDSTGEKWDYTEVEHRWLAAVEQIS